MNPSPQKSFGTVQSRIVFPVDVHRQPWWKKSFFTHTEGAEWIDETHTVMRDTFTQTLDLFTHLTHSSRDLILTIHRHLR